MAAAVLVSLFAASCGDDDVDDASPPTKETADTTSVLTTEAVSAVSTAATTTPATTTTTTATTAAPTAPPPTTPAATTAAPPITGGAGYLGDALLLGDGSIARVNALVMEPPAPLGLDLDPGLTLAVLDVEQCAGPEPIDIDPFGWKVLLPDGTSFRGEVLIYELPSHHLASGTCARGDIYVGVTAGSTIAAISVEDVYGDPVGWLTDLSTVPTSPLVAPVAATTEPLGQAAPLPDGGSVTVRAVTVGLPNPYPQDPIQAGWQLIDLDVEVCGGAEPARASDAFYVLGSDNRAGPAAIINGGTLEPSEAAPGECLTGTVDVHLPATSTPRYAVYDLGSDTILVWQL